MPKGLIIKKEKMPLILMSIFRFSSAFFILFFLMGAIAVSFNVPIIMLAIPLPLIVAVYYPATMFAIKENRCPTTLEKLLLSASSLIAGTVILLYAFDYTLIKIFINLLTQEKSHLHFNIAIGVYIFAFVVCFFILWFCYAHFSRKKINSLSSIDHDQAEAQAGAQQGSRTKTLAVDCFQLALLISCVVYQFKLY